MTRNIEEAFREHLITEATGFEPGVAVSESLAQNSLNMLEEGESKGATFLLGGAGFSKSASLRPTIGYYQRHGGFDEEAFGPSVSLYIAEDD